MDWRALDLRLPRRRHHVDELARRDARLRQMEHDLARQSRELRTARLAKDLDRQIQARRRGAA